MRTVFVVVAGCAAALALAACGSAKTNGADICRAGDVLCGATCDASQPCGGSGSPSKFDGGGGDNPGLITDSGPLPDTGYLPPDACQFANVSSQRVIPTVVLVIDQSASMNDKFSGNTSRWDTLRDFLLKSDGLIASFENQVRFGFAMYSAKAPDSNGQPTCPIVTSVSPAIKNYAAISDVYKMASPIGDTPTGDAIDKIVAGLPMPAPDQQAGPTVLILATDGEPDRCEELNPQNGQAEAVAAVQHAFEAKIRTFIISVGTEVSTTHQQDVANAGVGHKPGEPNAPYWRAGDDATLRSALTEIIGAQVSCDVTLKGAVQSDGGDPCDGHVELNNVPLDCKGKDGWQLVDPTHIRLLGKACSDFKTQPMALVNARFPCSVQVIF
jgi:hypothetical protein